MASTDGAAAPTIVCGLCGFGYVHPNWHKTVQECLDAAHERVRALETELADLTESRDSLAKMHKEEWERAEKAEAGGL